MAPSVVGHATLSFSIILLAEYEYLKITLRPLHPQLSHGASSLYRHELEELGRNREYSMTQTHDLQRLRKHLQEVHDNPATPLDQKLLDTASYIYSPELGQEASRDLILQIYQLLPTLQQDPTPVNRLLSKLLEPIPLSTLLSFEPPVDFVAGLDLAAEPYNLLTLSLLEKADVSSAQYLATSQPLVFVSLVRLWLATGNEGVADKASKILLHLLAVDKRESAVGGWDGSVWKRIFRDKDIYGQIYSICSLNSQEPIPISKSRKTVAQARLLDWIPAVADMDWDIVTKSYIPEIEQSFSLNPGYEGLLDFAAVHMVDYKSDVLMHRTLITFFSALLTTITSKSNKLSSTKPSSNTDSSLSLDFLTTRGLHSRTLAYYIHPDSPSHDPLDATFLYGPAADYVASYASTYPSNFAQSGDLQARVIQKITAATTLSDTRWRHSDSPSEDLHVLSSLPRTYLVSLGSSSPHLNLPTKFPNADILNTLATIFHGPIEEKEVTFPAPATAAGSVEQAAETLYTSYLTQNPHLWPNVLLHADTLSLLPSALASTNLLKSIITAPWPGIAALMSSPTKSIVVPWLVGPPKTFSNLVGGMGDAESAAYRVAVARWECVRAFWEGLREADREEWKGVERVVRRRVEEGAWGARGDVGGRVGTLEL